MKYNPEESYEQWLERVRQLEYGIALQRIAKGDTVEEVMEDMSRRIIEKTLYPILKALRDIPTNYDVEKSKQTYKENYLNKTKPVADHVVDD
jgi:glutamyl-tRNA reductase